MTESKFGDILDQKIGKQNDFMSFGGNSHLALGVRSVHCSCPVPSNVCPELIQAAFPGPSVSSANLEANFQSTWLFKSANLNPGGHFCVSPKFRGCVFIKNLADMGSEVISKINSIVRMIEFMLYNSAYSPIKITNKVNVAQSYSGIWLSQYCSLSSI